MRLAWRRAGTTHGCSNASTGPPLSNREDRDLNRQIASLETKAPDDVWLIEP
jgi:hypothetical protein